MAEAIYPLKEFLDWLTCQVFVAGHQTPSLVYHGGPEAICTFWGGSEPAFCLRATLSLFIEAVEQSLPAFRLFAVPLDHDLPTLASHLRIRRRRAAMHFQVSDLVASAKYRFRAELA